ncbi:MAG: hypothetical protein AB1797_00955 [bacterium]
MNAPKSYLALAILFLLMSFSQSWQKNQVTRLGYRIIELENERRYLENEARSYATEKSCLVSPEKIFQDGDIKNIGLEMRLAQVITLPEPKDNLPAGDIELVEGESKYLAVLAKWAKDTRVWVVNHISRIRTQIKIGANNIE